MADSCCDNTCSCGCDSNRENKLCEMTKPHNQFDIKKILPLVNDAKYFCRCCGRLANRAENLCNPIELNK
jgi:hypothetical protein